MKTINKIMTNEEIYSYALNLINEFDGNNNIYFPAAVNFSIQKNKALLINMAEEIEKSRINIIQHYGVINDDGSTNINPEYVDKANKELQNLLNIMQDVKIYTFAIEDMDEVKLTFNQMQAIMFMINEENNN